MAAPTPKDPRVGAFLEDGSGLMWQGDKWTLEQRLGSGRFASVYKLSCASNPSRQTLAAKVTTLQGISAWARSQLTEELAIWQTLRHPNVVRLHGYLSDKTKHVLLLELARGGELFERIVSMQFFSEQLAARQVGQVLSALEYLHSFGVLHRDLKPENLLLETPDDDSRVKIADFGASKLVISSGAKTPCGSLGYAAPEQLRGLKFAQDPSTVAPYDKEVDLWSVGVITYILLSGSMPFDPSTYSVERLEQGDALDFPFDLFGECSPEAIAFIRALLQVNPTKRLSAGQALRHPWLRGGGEPPPSSAVGAPRGFGGAGASMPTPTPTPRLTPLPTPRRLRALQESGLLKKGWNVAAEAARKGQAAEAPIGSEGEAARELAKKRTAEELVENAEVPMLMLPAEVSKRIRMASEESTRSQQSASSAEERGEAKAETPVAVSPPVTDAAAGKRKKR